MKTPILPILVVTALVASTTVAFSDTEAASENAATAVETQADGSSADTIEALEKAIEKLENAVDVETAAEDADDGAAAVATDPSAASAESSTPATNATTPAAPSEDPAPDEGEADQTPASSPLDNAAPAEGGGGDDQAQSAEEAADSKPAGSDAPALLVQVKDANAVVTRLELTVGKLMGMEVHDSDGKKISTVKEVLGTPEGSPTAIAVDIGGFLGIGAKEVIIPVEALKLSEDKLALDLNKDQIEELPNRN